MANGAEFDLDAAAIREELERVVASRTFAAAGRSRKFLSYVVERSLAGAAPKDKSREAGQRAVKATRGGVKELSRHPEIRRPVEDMLPEFREWVVEFGQSAYVALYHFDGEQVVILAVRHGREAGY